MITFTSPLWHRAGESSGRWYFLTVPEDQSAEIRAEAMALPRGFGSVRVEACIHDIRWRTSVFPLKSGGYLLPIKAQIRKRAALSIDDPVTVELTLIG